MRTEKVTIKDVARRTGVSEVTASVVVNGSRSGTRVSDASRSRILAAAAELGYRRNSSAHAITTGKFNSIALLVSSRLGQSYLSDEILDGIHAGVNGNNLSLLASRLPDDRSDAPASIPKFLREWTVDGVLIDYIIETPDYLLEQVRDHSLPAIWINTRRDFDCVRPDDYSAGRLAAEYLIRLGHRRIDFTVPTFSYPIEDHYSVTDRCAGYSEVMTAAGLSPHIVRNEVSARLWVPFARQWLKQDDRPTAIIGYSPTTARPVLFAALSIGLRVPEDLSIISFNVPATDPMSGHIMSAVSLPEFDMGKAGVELLIRKIASPLEPIPACVLPVHIHEGETCGPVSGSRF